MLKFIYDYFQMKRIGEFKVKNAELLANLMPEDERESFTKHNVVNVLTDRDHKGRRVLVVNCGSKCFFCLLI